ncbi:MAG: hypothetical protein GX621_15165, partial [Pirellulaceae bacterium]|nr:hypothetical protein [Pirellulaceae bacterium]
RGYFEGIFSNTFPCLRFDEEEARLKVVRAIDLPHVSRYGTNTINSTNSGKLLPQPDGVLRGLGDHGGLWHDPLLSHEQVELGPCCWVAPWTKVVGQSPEPHADDEALVNDRLTTYLMPFSIAGVEGDLTRGLVMPGELSVGLGPKQRRGAWVFTYAPGAVISMVARLHAALPDDRKAVANTIVDEAIRTAIEMTRAMAAEYQVDLDIPLETQPRAGWPRWIATTHALLRVHLDEQLWRFDQGRPCEWRAEADRWHHPRLDAVLKFAPDATERQWNEESLFQFEDPVRPLQFAVPAGSLDESLRTGRNADVASDPAGVSVNPEAKVHPSATIAPGCRIGPGTIVEADATIWRSALENCRIEAGATIERSEILGGRVGANCRVRSCRVIDSEIGDDSTAEAASIERSRLARRATVSPFAEVSDVESQFAVILGGGFRAARIQTNLMSMHLAGDVAHVEARPTPVVIDGQTVEVAAIPMIGGGAILRGTAGAPVVIECSFIGSNAILEPGVRLGFGCFVLGRVAAGSGLPPFTLATDEDPRKHQIGGVLGSLPSTIITHFLSWTYQAVDLEMASAVSELVRQSVVRGIAAVERELAQRTKSNPFEGADHRDYASLADYTDAQLQAGLSHYRRSFDSGAWNLAFREGQLRFISPTGYWLERSGSVLWKENG